MCRLLNQISPPQSARISNSSIKYRVSGGHLRHIAPRQHSGNLRKCWSGGEPFATLFGRPEVWTQYPSAYEAHALTVRPSRWKLLLLILLNQFSINCIFENITHQIWTLTNLPLISISLTLKSIPEKKKNMRKNCMWKNIFRMLIFLGCWSRSCFKALRDI